MSDHDNAPKNKVVITRDANDTINGIVRGGRVYVAGPHFRQSDIFSSTTDPAEATRYDRDEAEIQVRLRSWRNARIEEAP